MSQLRQHQDRLVRNNIEVVIISFEDAENVLNYQNEADLGWPVAVDKTRELYRYFGFNKASFWDLWGFATWRIYFKEMLKGNMPRLAKDDVQQRGGDVLINPEGLVKIHHIGKGPADRPVIEDLFNLVEAENKLLVSSDQLRNLKN